MVREGNTLLYRRALESAEWEGRWGGKLGARSKSLDKRVSEGAKATYGRSSKKPTVGRLDDPQLVAMTTYRRVLWRVLAGGEGKGSLPLDRERGSSPRKGAKNLSPKLG